MKNLKMVVGSVFVVMFLVLAYVVFKGGWLTSREGAPMGMDAAAVAPRAPVGAEALGSPDRVTAPARPEPVERMRCRRG
ncbi:hypothetical protein [Hydrogenophaga sp.]|uniref:hypothetical protein n=1 Tax=Hydrogenophaga sp. TaxID=1904254 RepID=UPI003F71F050